MSPDLHDPELAYLEELMKAFPVEAPPSTIEAFHLVQERYRRRWTIAMDGADPHVVPQVDVQSPEDYPIVLTVAIREIHDELFHGILSNVGEFRRLEDPNRGEVWFGPHDGFYRGVRKFKGSEPMQIFTELIEVGDRYQRECLRGPLRAVCSFYQRFVHIHPFYDANGRIARLIAAILLRSHGLAVRWSEMESKNNEFIRRLNAVHKHSAQPSLYLDYLTSHVRKFTATVDQMPDSVA